MATYGSTGSRRYMSTDPRALYRQTMRDDLETGAEAEQDYLRRAREYDPYAAAQRAGRATYDILREDFGRDLAELRSFNAGIGRLETGYGADDEHRAYLDLLDRLNRQIAANSLQAAGLELQNLQGLGSFGQNVALRGRDLVAGELDRRQAEENARKARRLGYLKLGADFITGLADAIIPG